MIEISLLQGFASYRTELLTDTLHRLDHKSFISVVPKTFLLFHISPPHANVLDTITRPSISVSTWKSFLLLFFSLSQANALDTLHPQAIYFSINASGVGLGPFECWLLLRGVKTLGVRMDRQQQNAMRIAEWLVEKGLKVCCGWWERV